MAWLLNLQENIPASNSVVYGGMGVPYHHRLLICPIYYSQENLVKRNVRSVMKTKLTGSQFRFLELSDSTVDPIIGGEL